MKEIIKYILCDILGIVLVTILCYFIFKEKIIYSMIGVFIFSITLGILTAKKFYYSIFKKEVGK